MQNYQTRTVRLNQRQFEAAQAFPLHPAPRAGWFAWEGYRVVDVDLREGATHEGLLLVGGDHLLVPEHLAGFSDVDIVELRPTPIEKHPDFTITDPDSVQTAHGIEHGNLVRLHMFGPETPERDWRSAPVEEAHGQAREDDDRVETLGDLAELLDVPEAVDREVFLRTMAPWKRPLSFRPWIETMREGGFVRDTDIDWLEVYPVAHVSDELAYTFSFDSHAVGKILEEDQPEGGFRAGDRIKWSLWGYGAPARLRNVPLRYDPELVLPVPHEEMMAFLRGPRRDWLNGGREGPEPDMPVKLRAKRTITLGEYIGALFGEISSRNWEWEEG